MSLNTVVYDPLTNALKIKVNGITITCKDAADAQTVFELLSSQLSAVTAAKQHVRALKAQFKTVDDSLVDL